MPTATMQTKIENCEVHNIPCVRFFVEILPGQGSWHGQCDLCIKDDKFLSAATQMEEKTREETLRIVRTELEQCDAEIAAQVQTEIDAYVQETRDGAMDRWQEWVADVKRRRWDDLFRCAQADRVTQFMDELRKAGN